MALSRSHVMASNQRLIRQILKDLYGEADKAWCKVYSSFCKRHADLYKTTFMQFKYKGKTYHLAEDVLMRSGVKPLHPELESEFDEVFAMFVEEVDNEKRILQNILSHAIRIAKIEEDLVELLPPIMHAAIAESGFFQMPDKPMMQVSDAEYFKQLYEEHFPLFSERKLLGELM